MSCSRDCSDGAARAKARKSMSVRLPSEMSPKISVITIIICRWDGGRWMPLGAITLLAIYCLSAVDTTKPPHGIPELAGVAVTVATHQWRHNAILTIITGTAACLLMTNWFMPA